MEELFCGDYVYFFSMFSSWFSYVVCYVEKIIEWLGLIMDSFVIEVVVNDGYLFKNFVVVGVFCLGIELIVSMVVVVEKLGIVVLKEFFGENLGRLFLVKG